MKTKLLLLITATAALLASCQSGDMTYNRYYANGSMLYASHCQNCHGLNGEGLSALIPPFTDSVYLRKNLTQLPCFVKNGLKDTLHLAGKTYTGNMPAKPELSSIEIAEVLTYVTNSFGNKMGLTDVGKVNSDLAGCR